MEELLFRNEVYEIIGCAIEVHRILGSGFLEAVYQEALEVELRQKEIPYTANKTLAVTYKGIRLRKEYVADFVCMDKILMELKALDGLTGREEAQVINYLKVSGFRIGLLINFGSIRKLEWKRIIV
ncbi:MAG: GxxExxY protein [Anaerolineales bacterium]